MFYCTVNILEGKINHIYTTDKSYDECIHVANMLRFNWMNISFKLNGKYYKRKPVGLPMVISVDTDNESEVKDLVFTGKYTIEQEYKYATIV
jgi:hypothetical protein